MDLGLCLVVRDEAPRIARCLDPIINLLSEVVVVDTGSIDGTPELVSERYGIKPLRHPIADERCRNLAAHRQFGLARLATPWCISLDADEVVDPGTLRAFMQDSCVDSRDGWFCAWQNHMPDGEVFEDYKLAFFRNGYCHRGMKHENVQSDIRSRGGSAGWTSTVEIRHFPESAGPFDRRATYRQQLLNALAQEPHWLRHFWFLGYMDFRAGQFHEAEAHLRRVAGSRSTFFPVEVLNSHMVLCELLVRAGREAQVEAVLQSMEERFQATRDDFEVQVNFRLYTWIRDTRELLDGGRAREIRAYRFAC